MIQSWCQLIPIFDKSEIKCYFDTKSTVIWCQYAIKLGIENKMTSLWYQFVVKFVAIIRQNSAELMTTSFSYQLWVKNMSITNGRNLVPFWHLLHCIRSKFDVNFQAKTCPSWMTEIWCHFDVYCTVLDPNLMSISSQKCVHHEWLKFDVNFLSIALH